MTDAPSAIALALAPELALAAGAMVVLLGAAGRPDDERRRGGLLLGALVACVLALAGVVLATRLLPTDGVGPLATDPFRWVADAVILLATALALVLLREQAPPARPAFGEPAALVLLAATGMLLLAGARDLTLVFLGVELMSIASYALAGIDRRSARSAEAALKYFLLGAFSTGFLLYGMALLYGATGTTALPEIGAALRGTAGGPPTLAIAGLALLLVGLAFKVAAVPFHLWTPDVYDGAPMPVTAFFAAAAKAATFTALVRVTLEAVAPGLPAWHTAVWWLAALTMLAGNAFAIRQANVKRMLAYSSVAHAGFLLVAVATQSVAGAAAVQFYLLAYGLASLGAFAVLSTVGEAPAGGVPMARLEGLWQARPWLAAAMAVFMFALLGFPLAGGAGFFAKWYVLQAALSGDRPETALAVVLVVATVLSAAFYLRVVAVMFTRERPSGSAPVAALPPLTRAAIAFAAVVILALGLYPAPLVNVTRATATVSFPSAARAALGASADELVTPTR